MVQKENSMPILLKLLKKRKTKKKFGKALTF